MHDTKLLRSKVARYSFIFAAAAEIISLIFTKGFNIGFAYGLLLGTAVGVANFYLLSFTIEKVFSKNGKKAVVFSMLGFIARMAALGAVFIMAWKMSYLAGIACLIGFTMTRISIYYINFVKKSIFGRE